MSDNKYFDLIFEGQFIFVPNVEDLSLTVYRPGNSEPTVIKSGALHSWNLEEACMNQSNTREQRSTTSFAEVRVSRKVARKGNQQDVGDYARKPLPTNKSHTMWVPKEINRSRGLFNRSADDNLVVIENIQKHINLIEEEGELRSSFQIKVVRKGRRSYHELQSVRVDTIRYSMEEIDLTVVHSLFDSTNKTCTFGSEKEAISFGNTFLLLMVYPGRWFPKLFGVTNDLSDSTLLVKRKRHMDFYLTKTGENGWMLTPKSSNKTYEYT
jgi:hypothetical protein